MADPFIYNLIANGKVKAKCKEVRLSFKGEAVAVDRVRRSVHTNCSEKKGTWTGKVEKIN